MKIFALILIIVSILAISNCKKQNEECLTKCNQKGESGTCKGSFKRFYFDRSEQKCYEFIWGGCDGVVPFQTLEECQSCGCN